MASIKNIIIDIVVIEKGLELLVLGTGVTILAIAWLINKIW